MILWVLLGLSLVIAIAYWRDREAADGTYGLDEPGGLGCFTGCVCVAVAVVAVLLLLDHTTHHRTDRSTHHVVTLQDTSGVQGDVQGGLFFTTGHIGQRLYLNWYEEEGGVFTPHTISSAEGDIRIHQVPPGAQPRVVESQRQHRYTFPWWTVEPPVSDLLGHWQDDGGKSYDIYVPRGTIAQGDYRLDAK